MNSGITIEPFRGDLEELERMAHTSWRDEYGIASFPNLYKPDYLRYLFGRLKDRRLLMAAYRGGEIVTFFANLPHNFCFHGRPCRGVLSCLLVTRREQLRQGVAMAVIEEALKLNRELRFDFALMTLETGHRSTKMVNKFKEAGNPVKWVKKMNVLARVLDLDRVASSEGLKAWEKAAIRLYGAHREPRSADLLSLREYRPEDLDACLELLNQYGSSVSLARVWERDELAWELDFPGLSRTLVYEKQGKIQALINFLCLDHIGKTVEKWAWFNHLAFPNLSAKERSRFIESFLRYAKDEGCIGAIEWTRKYYPLGALYRARFFPYPRALNMMSWNFNPEFDIAGIPDVYEVQV